MHHYQLVPDNVDMEPGDTPSTASPTPPLPSTTITGAITISLNEKDIESQLPPKYEHYHQLQREDNDPPSPTPPSSTLLPTQPSSPRHTLLRKPWVILSLPIAIAVLISTSAFICLSSSSSLTYVSSMYPSSIEQQQLQEDRQCGEVEASKFPFGLGGGVLSSSSWPRIPFSPVIVSVPGNSVTAVVSEEGHQVVVIAQANEAGMDGNAIVVNGETMSTEIGLDGIEIISVDPATDMVETVVVAVEVKVEVEAEQANEDLREDDDEDDDDDEEYEDGDDDDDGEEDDEDWDEEEDYEDWDEEEDDEEEGDAVDEKAEGQAVAALVRSVGTATTTTASMLDEIAALEAELIDRVMIQKAIDNTLDGMNLDLSEDGVGTGDVVLLSLRRNDDNEAEEEAEEDEDEQDHFPTNIGNDDEGDEDGDEGDEDEQLDEKPDKKGKKNTNNNGDSSNTNINGDGDKSNSADENKSKDNNNSNNKKKHNNNKHNSKHKHKHQDQNANLGGTGGNGPILLCSSKSCLPSLRDSILSRLSIQVHQVMDHLRSRHTLIHMMTSTAPQTKESLMAGQEELVQQLEDRIIKDLRDWVNGVGRKSKSGGNKKAAAADGGSVGTYIGGVVGYTAMMPEHGTFPLLMGDQSTENSQEVTVEMEGLFLGDDFEEVEDGSEEGFHMASLSFEDDDDDDEDHEDDYLDKGSVAAATATKNKQTKSIKKGIKLHRRDTSSPPSSPSSSATATTAAAPREYFLSADKLLMRQEWSRWIAHWVHHTKLLILSHTLATQSLAEMNKVAVSGENVVPVDQRHWSWNLDKALATVMVASEMICGGPSSAKDVKVFLSTLSMSSASTVAATGTAASGGDGSLDLMSPKALAITLNAQRCIESWSDELEEILQRTATAA